MGLKLKRLKKLIVLRIRRKLMLSVKLFLIVLIFLLSNVFFLKLYAPVITQQYNRHHHQREHRHFQNSAFEKVKERSYQWIPDCNCFRDNFYYRGVQHKRLNSSCSDPGTFFQPNQKVISYTLFIPSALYDFQERRSLYMKGIFQNLEAMRRHYPTYSMRLYTVHSPLELDFCYILCNNPDLFWCDVGSSPSLGDLTPVFFMIWRFFPLGDPTVDHFLSRDLDSLLTAREAAVVQNWLRLPQKKAIHLMRDKATVHDVPILGGMWGARNPLFGGNQYSNAKYLLEQILGVGVITPWMLTWAKDHDQQVLTRQVFIPNQYKIVAYDSYHCTMWSRITMVRPFPVQRKDNEMDFVGNTGFGKDKYKLEKCPVECRPSNGKDWEYC